jgi:methylated-DNA-[protein]-cysteine S-methyltransferase
MEFIELGSPIGDLLIVGDQRAVREIHFPGDRRSAPGWQLATEGPVPEAARQLEAYFARERREFDLPLAPEGTPFQQRVWRELQKIPYGQTLSYGEIARHLGNASASRAVGAANGANPIPIVVPCHRAIGADGGLTGFGGGLEVKAKLLALESGQRLLGSHGMR